MRARIGFAAVLLVFSTVLAGCISGNNDAGAVKAAAAPSTTNATCFDGSCSKIVAFEETNKTEAGVGGVDHTHDYWAGRERVLLFQTDASMAPAAGSSATAEFRPPQGTFVWEGTEHVDFTLTNPQRHVCEPAFTLGGQYICDDNLNNHSAAPKLPGAPDPSGGPAGLKLRYKHASTIAWIDAGEVVWGKPLSIKVTHPTQTDMPHATSSSWEFQVVSPNGYDNTLEFTAKAEIVRGVGVIPQWPGHPNFYADTTSRKVLDIDAVACDTQGCQLPGNEKAGPVAAQKLISYGTRSLHVWVNISDVQAPLPPLAPSSWFLYHVNSTGQTNGTNTFDSTNHPMAKKEHYWVLPVDDNGMDSPYSDGSKWTFQLGGSLITPRLSCYGGCAAWSAKYHITVIATNKALPLKEYEMFCLHPENYCPKPDAPAASSDAYAQADPQLVGPLPSMMAVPPTWS